MYCAYVTRIHNLRKHTNADRLLCGECFGNTVIVDLGTDPDQLGVYFPTDGKLGLEFAQKNDLLRRKDENGAPAGGYLDPEKRNIKALKLRGEKSDGLFLPLSCLASFTDIKKLQEGDTISVLNGITICEKYVPAVKRASGSGGGGNHVRKRSDPISPLFQEHADTEQLAYNLSAFHAGDLVEVTLKMHGTSQRTGYLPVLQGYKYRNRMEKRLYESRKTPNVIRSKIKRHPSMIGAMLPEPAAWFWIPSMREASTVITLSAKNTPTSLKESSTRERRSTTRLLASLTMVRPS